METSNSLTHVWCICHINKDGVKKLDIDLSKDTRYMQLEAYIPTVKVLKKKFKGEEHFDEVPLLFNYAFFKMPIKFARDPEFLISLKNDISCIYSWVKDPAAVMSEHPVLSIKNIETRHNSSEYSCATATEEEIAGLLGSAAELSIYSKEDIYNLNPGDSVTLHGFPFDGVDATIEKINHKKKEVKVKLELHRLLKQVTVSFDNIFYTIYKSKYNEEPLREVSLDQLREGTDNHSLDNLFTKCHYYQEPDEYGENGENR